MNKIFKVIWSKSKQCYIVVSEIAKNKTGKKKIVVASILAALTMTANIVTVEGAIPEGTRTDHLGLAIGTSSNSKSNQSIAIGYASSAQAPGANPENPATAVGAGANANGVGAVALGLSANATGANAVALGGGSNGGTNKTEATGTRATAISFNAKASGSDSIALGNATVASDEKAIAIGSDSKATDVGTTALGRSSAATGASATALGSLASATGTLATAVGMQASASGNESLAIGTTASATSGRSLAVGTNSKATGATAVAVGSGSGGSGPLGFAGSLNSTAGVVNTNRTVNYATTAEGDNAVALGFYANAKNSGVAVGQRALAATGGVAIGKGVLEDTGNNYAGGVVIGQDSATLGPYSLAMGFNAFASGSTSMAIGHTVSADGGFAVAMGRKVSASGTSTAIGHHATATNGGLAIGSQENDASNDRTTASAKGAVAIGKNTKATSEDAVAIGTNAQATRLNSVALGSGSTTATGATNQGSATINGITYNFAGATGNPNMQVSVGSTGATRQIKNVAAGEVSATSTDAINGSQLYAVASAVKPLKYVSINSTATGTGSNVDNDGAQAPNSIAIGPSSTVTKQNSIAFGNNAQSLSDDSITIGRNAKAEAGPAFTTTSRAIAIGANSKVATNVTQGIAIGSGSLTDEGAVVTGDQSIAIGGNVKVDGHAAVAIGGDDARKAAGQQVSYTNTNDNEVTGTLQTAIQNLTGYNLSNYKGTAASHAGVAYGTSALAGNAGVAIGTASDSMTRMNDKGQVVNNKPVTNAVAIGTGARANFDNSVAIGGGSNTDRYATKQVNAIIDGVEVKWSGGENISPGDVVSFGAKGFERQLKNVAPGEVSQTSTDAINGSQIYSLARKVTNIMNGGAGSLVNVNASGEPLTKVVTGTGTNKQEKYYRTVDVKDDGTLVTGAIAQTPKSLALVNVDEPNVNQQTQTPRTLGNVANGVNDNDAVNVSQLKAATVKYFSVNSTDAGNRDNTGATGTNAIAIGPAATATKAQSIALGNSATAGGTDSIAIGNGSVAADKVAPVAIGQGAQANGDFSVALGGGNWQFKGAQANGVGTTALGTYSKTAADTSYQTVVGFGANTTKANATAIGYNSAVSTEGGVALGANSSSSTGRTVGYNPNDGRTNTYSALTGNVIRSTTGAVAVGNGTEVTRQITGVAAGTNDTDAVNVAQLKSVNLAFVGDSGFGDVNLANNDTTKRFAVKGDSTYLTTRANGNLITVSANKKDISVTNGTATAATGMADAKNVAEAINKAVSQNAYTWNLTADNDTAGSRSTINKEGTVKFSGDKNITVARNGNTITSSLNKSIIVDSVKANNSVTTGSGSNQITLDGTTGAVTGNTFSGQSFTAGDNVLSNTTLQIGSPTNGNNVTITKDGLTSKAGTKTAKFGANGIDAGGQQITNVSSGGNVGTNAANITDVKNAVSDVTLKLDTNSKTGTVKLSESPLKVIGANGIRTDLVGTNNGSLVVGLDSNTVNATTKGIGLTGDTGSTGLKYLKDGDASFKVAGDGNLVTTKASATGVQVAVDTAKVKDLAVEAVTVSKANTSDNPITVTPTAGTNSKDYAIGIDTTKLASKTDLTYRANNDADANAQKVSLAKGLNFVNGDNTVATVAADGKVSYDLNAATKTKVDESATAVARNISLGADSGTASSQSLKDGDVAFNVKGATGDYVSTNMNGNTVEVSTKRATINSDANTGAASVTGNDGLATAKNVADAINKAADAAKAGSAWNLSANGDTSTKVSGGDTVEFTGDNNITVDRNNKTISTSLNKNLTDMNSISLVNPRGETIFLNGRDGSIQANKAEFKDNAGTSSTITSDQLKITNGLTDDNEHTTAIALGTISLKSGNNSSALDSKNLSFSDEDGNNAEGNAKGFTFQSAAGKQVEFGVDEIKAGGNKIQEVAEGTADTDAVNVKQLKDTVASQTLTYRANTAADADAKSVKLSKGLDFVDGTSTIATVDNDGKVSFDLNTATKTKIDDSATAVARNISLGADSGTASSQSLKDGDVAFNVKGATGDYVSTNMNGNTVEVSTKRATINSDANTGAASVTGNDGLATAKNVADAINKAADAAKAGAAWNLTTNSSTTDKTSVQGGDTVDLINGDNILITQDGTDKKKITVATKKDLTVDSVTAGNTVINTSGLTNGTTAITGSGITTDKVTVGGISIDKTDGINAGGKAISNVASGGTTDTNAANIGDVKQAVANLSQNLNITDGTNNGTVDLKNQKLNVAGANGVTATVNNQTITVGLDANTVNATTKGIGLTADTGSTGNKYLKDGDVSFAVTGDGNLVSTSATAAGVKVAVDAAKVKDLAVDAVTVSKDAQADNPITVTPTAGTNSKDYAIGIDTTKLAAKTDLTYRANNDTDANAKKVSLAKGLNFVNGTLTTASIDNDGVVKYDVNTAVITAGTDGTVTGPTTDGVATAQNVADAINAAKKASKTEITANTGEAANATTGNVTLTSTAAADGHTIYDVKLNDKVTLGTGANAVTIDGTTGKITAKNAAIGGVTLDGDNSHVTGLSNTTWNGTATTGRAATEDQLKAVADTAKATTDAVNLKFSGDTNTSAGVVNLKDDTFNIVGDGKYVTTDANGKALTVKVSEAEVKKSAVSAVTVSTDTTDTNNPISVTPTTSADGTTKDYKVTIDGTKIANKTNLSYKANDSTAKQVSLADGLNFKNGTLTTASIDDAGVVKYDVNTATITAGTDGTVTGPTTDGVATAQNVADAINAAKKAAKTEITANTGEAANATTGNMTLTSTTAADGHTIYDIKLNDKVTLGTGANAVTIDGTAGTVTGLTNKDWTPGVTKAVTGRAATEDQLQKVADAASSQTWNITADKAGTTGAQTGTKKNATVGKDQTVELVAGDNLTINQDERKFTYSLNKDLAGLTSVSVGDGITETIKLDGATGKVTAKNAVIGGVTVDGDNSHVTGLSNTTWNGTATTGRAATEDQLKAVSDTAKATTDAVNLKFSGDTNTSAGVVNLKDDTFNIVGDGKYVTTDANGKDLTVKVSEAEVKKSAVSAVTVSTDTTDANNPISVTPTTSADGTTKDYKVTIDGTKIANKTNLSYKANDGTAKLVSLADGLNFKNGTLTTASIDDAGVVKYDVNTATITAGTDGTVTGPTTDGVATAQNVADAINAAKKAAKTEITANTGEAANATTGNVTLTSTTAADGHTIYDVKLNDKVTLGTGANAVTIDGTAGKATVGTAVVDGVNNTITTGGANAVSLDGAAGKATIGSSVVDGVNNTITTGGANAVSLDGAAGTVTGLTNKDWTPGVTKAVTGRAATEDQLQKVADAASSQTWNITADKAGTTGAQTGTKKNATVGKDQTVELVAGDNLTINQDERKFTYSLNKDLAGLTSVSVGDGTTETINLDGATGKITAKNAVIGGVTVDGDNSHVTGLSNTTWNGTATTGRAATEDQLKAVADTAKATTDAVNLKFSGDTNTSAGVVNLKDDTFNIVGDGKYVTTDANGKDLTVKVSEAEVKKSAVAAVTVSTDTTDANNPISVTPTTSADGTTKDYKVTIDGTKIANKTNLSYKANDGTAKQVSLADGLNFKNGILTTASIDDAGVVKYDVNTAAITAGTDGTVTGPTTDGVATAQNVADAINAAKKAAKTEITANTGEAANATTGNVTLTSTTAADGHTIYDVKLNDKVTLGTGANAVTIDGTAGKATVGTAVVDGVNNTITTGGANAVALEGAAGTVKTGTVTVTGGTTNDITGLSNTTVTAADFAIKGRAATEEQLKAVGEQTWKITADKDATTSGAQTGTKKDAKVGKDDKVQLIAGENLTVNQNERDFTYSLNKDLVKMNSATFEATGGKTTVITGDSIAQTDGTKTNTSTAAGNTVADGGKSTATTADGTTVTNGADSTATTAAGTTVTSANGNTNYAADGVRINTTGKNPVSLTDAGLDNGNNVIKNVASGHVNNDDTDNTNAANIADVKKATTTVTANNGEAANATTGNVTLTSTTAADGHTIYDVKLNDKVTLGTGANAVTIDGTAGKATIGSSVVDGVNNTITTGGANAVALDGAAGTVKTGTVTVSGGTTNDITGLSNTTVNAADFATKGRAATEEQLKAVGEQTWQITADKDATTSGAQTGTKKDAKVGKDDKVQLIAGENLTVNQNERDFTYSLNKDLVKMNSATFEATGGKTTVITGDSIAQTDGTKTNTSTAAGNTVADGGKSTATTADGTTVTNGADSTATTAAGTTVTSANGNTNYAADGVRINTTGKNPVSLTDAGLDNGNNVIKNVASGHVNNDDTDNTNAANIADVKKATTTVTANNGEAANATTGNVTLTSTTAADGHTIYDVKLNDKVTLGTGANAVTIDGTAGKATVGTAVVDGVNNTITTGGANAVALDGAAGTVKTGTVTVTGGTTNDITGLSNTTVTAADFATKGRAATEEQLKVVGEQTWQITADKDATTSGAQTGTKKDAKVGKDDKVQLIAGENLTVNQNERDFTYSLNKDLVKMNSATFEATGGKTTVITGDSIAQTDGTKTNTSTAAGNTVADGTKSTETTAAGQVIKDGTKTNTSTVDENTLVDGAKSNKTTVDSNEIDDGNGNVNTSNATSNTITDGTNTSTITAGKATIGSSIIDGVNNTFTTGGANAVKLDGAAGTVKTGTVTVSGGTTNDITGLSNTTVTAADFATKGRAATEEQLKAVGEQTWQITADKDATTSGNQTGTKKDAKVGKDDKVQLIAGENLTVNQNERDFTYSLNKDLVKMNSATFEATGGKTTVITGDSIAQTDGIKTNTSTAAGNTVVDGGKSTATTADGTTVTNGADSTATTAAGTTVTSANGNTNYAADGVRINTTGKNPVSLTDAGLDNGNNVIKNVASGHVNNDDTDNTNAANIADVKKATTTVTANNGEAANATTGNVTLTSTTAADGHTIYDVKLNDTVTLGTGANAVTIDGTAGKATIGSSVVDGVNNTITTGGANAVALDGAAGTVKTGTVTVTGGTTNDITGLSNTTVTAADFATKGRAATEEQLKAVGEQTWQITADKDATTSGNQTGTKKDAKVGKDDKVQLIAGENLTVNQNERDFTYSLNKDLVKMNSATFEATGGKTTVITGDSIAQTDGTKTNTSTAAGNTVADGTKSTETTAAGQVIKDGAKTNTSTVDENTLVDGAKSNKTTVDSNVIDDGNGNVNTSNATSNTIANGADSTATTAAGTTVTNANGNTNYAADGVRINTTGKNPVSLTDAGLDNGNNVIKNVASGHVNNDDTDNTNAANIADVKKATTTVTANNGEAANATTGNVTLTSTTAADGHTIYDVKLNDTVTLGTGANAVTIDGTAGKATIGSSVVDGVNNTITTGGANAVVLNGADGTVKTGTVTLTGGTTNDITGLSNTTVTAADFATKGRAATEEQLKAVGEQTWQITADKDATTSGNQTGTKKDAKVGKDDKVQLIAGENLTVNQNERDFTYSLNKDLVKMNSATFEATGGKTTVITGDSIAQTDGTKTNTSTAAGNTVADGTKSTETTAAGQVIKDGAKTNTSTVDENTLVDGAKSNKTTVDSNVIDDGNGNVNTSNATSNTIANGANSTATTAAGTTVTNANGNTKYAADGVRINTTGKNPVSLTDSGLDNGNNVIKNVASGHVNNDDTDNTNAANIADVKKATTTVTANNGEAANATTGNVTLTSTTAADGHTIYDVKLNDKVTLGTGANAVTIDGTSGKATVGTAVVDGVNNTITTGGANAVALDGAAGTVKTGTVTLTGGTTNDITGLSNTTVNSADFATKGRAATEEQLKQVGEQTWQITADKDATTSGNQTGTKKDAKVGKDDKVQLIAGENLTVNQNERDFTYSLNKDLVKMNSATFEATGGKTTVITGDSIAQTDGTKTNRSTAAGNTVADGANSTATTAAGTTVTSANGNTNYAADGVRINTTGKNPVSLTDAGLDNGNNVIKNVASGHVNNDDTDNTNAANIADVKKATTTVTANNGEAANATTGNVTLTSTTAADGHTIYDVKLNDKVTLGTGANAVTIDGTSGKATVGTAVVDGVNNTITTGGANAVALDGAAGTVKTGTVTLTGGTTNDITGLSNTTVNSADFATKGRAATEEQLKQVGEQTWQITADKDTTTSGAQTGTKKDAKVGKDDKVQLIAGENLTVNQNERDFTYSLNKDLVKMNSATFEATGGKTTVITGDSIAQTDGTKTNRSTAAGNTVADGTKSTETTAAGQVIKDGAKTNTSTVDENTLVDGAKSNKTTVDSNVIDDGNGNVNTSNATSNTITDGTNTSTITAGKAQIGTVGIDGVTSKITTGGANAVVLNGADGTVKTGTVTLTGGTTNDITGLSNTTVNSVDFATKGRAATEEQLKAVGEQTWQITADKDAATSGAQTGTKKDAKVGKDDKVQLIAGENLTVNQNERDFTYSLNKDLVKMNSATFEATGGKTTVITGDSIAQTDGTKTNRSTAAGNTVADGTKSTETTAAGQVIKDGAKTNTSTVDENTLVDGAKSNKTTVDSNVIDDGNGNVNTSNATSNTITDGTNTSTITAGKATIGSSIIDGVNNTFTTGGANAVKLDGAAGTVKTGTVTVTGGTTNDITGLSNTTVNSADFATKGRAATEEQLKQVGEQTWQITADKDATTSGNQTGTKKDAKVGKDDKVQLIAGENLTVNQNERDFTYSLNKDLVKMNSATFEATGGKTTVITGDSIAQTDGTKTNTSTAAGNTVADGTKSTETTAAGQVIKDGAKTNTSTVDENTLVDGAKSNKTTVDSNVIDDGNGNVNTSNATSNTITDGTNTTEATASTVTVKDNAGNSTVITKDTITTGTGANKVTVDGTAGKVTAGSAVIDGVNNTITTGGANTVKLDGAAGTVTGLTNTAWTPGVTKAVSGRAATEDQLQQVSDAVGAGWNINSGTVAGSTGEANGSAKTKISSGEEVQLQAGNNLIIDQNGKTLAYSLNKNLKDMESAIFNATGGKTTVIKGDSIVQTDGGKTNTSNAAGNTVVDGTKSTATTAAGSTITDGAKTNTNTADKNVIDDGAGNTNTSNATSNTIADPNGNTNTATATSNTLADNAGNSNVSNATSNNLTDNAGNSNVSNATSNTLKNAAGDETKVDAKGATVKDAAGNTTNVASTGATVTNAAGDTTKVEATGTTVADAAGNKATFTKDGVTITKPGKDTVSLTGNGLDNGNNKIVNVADGTNDTDAVNVRQLDAKTKAATTELTANGGESANNTTGNIVLTKTTAPDGHIIYDNKLNDKITLGAADPTKAITVDGTNGTIKAGKDGNAVAINGTDGTIKAGDGTNAVAIDGVNGSVKVADKIALNGKDGKAAIGTVGIDGKDGIITTGGNNPVAVNGKDGVVTGLTNKTWDPNNITSGRAATEDQVQSAVANAGWDATVGTEGSGVNSTPSATPEKIRPNETLTFKAGNNMMVSHAGKTISYAVNPELTDMKSATFKDAAGNTTVTNGNGITITPGSANPNNPNAGPVSLTKDGLNNGNNQIKGVAPGSDDTDAVNIGQLKASNAKMGDAIGQVAGEVQRVGAHAAAMAALKPIQYDPLEPTQIMAGVGNYRGETAAALGLAHYTNEDTMFNVGVSVGGNHNMVNAGVTHKFGSSPEKKNIPDRYKAGPISSVYVMQDEVSSLKKENAEQKYVIADQAARLNTLEAENERQRQELAETKQGLDDLRAAVDKLLASKG